ncbi:MAG: hypothetical protein JSS81_11070 [Acidobacteria bacterium]|nr:hypothetical protein [Acidobacteriota bacterium]
MNKWLALPVLLLLVCAASAQKKRAADVWEYLEVSVVETGCGYAADVCRQYHYYNTGQTLVGPVALDWLEKAGWEPAGVVGKDDAFGGLLFRRAFNRERTKREAETLSELLDREYRAGSVDALVDLDRRDGKRDTIEFNAAEKTRLRAALEAIKDPPLEIVAVTAASDNRKKTRVGAEIVIDATKILLTGNNYRASAAETYFREAAGRILDRIGAASAGPFDGNAAAISGGGFRPRIGGFEVRRDGLTLKISVVVNYKSARIVVAQGWIYGDWRAVSR